VLVLKITYYYHIIIISDFRNLLMINLQFLPLKEKLSSVLHKSSNYYKKSMKCHELTRNNRLVSIVYM